MNAITPFPLDALPREPFDRAAHEVNEWRGRCLNSFTRGEAAITECLLALSAIPGRGGVELPHLLGQRFEALAAAIGVDGPFAPEGGIAAAALTRFREYASLRNMLCHGVTEITLDQRCRWTVVLRLTALRPGRVDREIMVMPKAEAELQCADLAKASQSLCTRLKSLLSVSATERIIDPQQVSG